MVNVQNNVLPDHIRLAAIAAFPTEDWPWWHRYENGKLATVDPSRIPLACVMALLELTRACEPANGFYDYDLYGAGLHLMPSGVSLGKHTDATHHPQRPWRRLSSLVYFLDDCEGGELTFNNQKVTPKANTAVTFPVSQIHEVQLAITDRRTLSLFTWELDCGLKNCTSAQFEVK